MHIPRCLKSQKLHHLKGNDTIYFLQVGYIFLDIFLAPKKVLCSLSYILFAQMFLFVALRDHSTFLIYFIKKSAILRCYYQFRYVVANNFSF